MLKRLGGAGIAIALIVGMKFYNKQSSHDDVKKRLVELCEADSACLQAVEQHFDSCFDQSYRLGGKRQASALHSDELVKCLNTRGGEEYFQVESK